MATRLNGISIDAQQRASWPIVWPTSQSKWRLASISGAVETEKSETGKQLMRLVCLAIVVAFLVPGPSQAGDVGVAVSIGEPGFYGHLEIGNFPRPEVVYAQPVLIQPVPVGVAVPPPLYVYVPPGHETRWAQYCGAYNACGRPVYFVREAWYNRVYVPEYQRRHGRGHAHGHGKGRGKGRR